MVVTFGNNAKIPYSIKCMILYRFTGSSKKVVDKSNHLQNAMFFMMRDEIFPTWEYPDNREGCSISFKVPASTLKNNWDLSNVNTSYAMLVKVIRWFGRSIFKLESFNG